MVQVNGKVRGKVTVSATATEDEVKAIAKADANVAKFLEGVEIVKEIYVPYKMLSLQSKTHNCMGRTDVFALTNSRKLNGIL
ncbi:leucyl-tRNA synthetase [Actinobacillus equuli]|nr:leucyl-tRNA synthetase [Actinobacillus equuli]